MRQNPVLYDAQLGDYKDAQLSQNIWGSIAQLMGREDLQTLCVQTNYNQEIFFRKCFFVMMQDVGIGVISGDPERYITSRL